MSYFSFLPKIQYNITGNKYGETVTARDIFIRNLIKRNVIENAISFEEHTIGDNERPDTTSFLVYGHVKYDWIIFLTNQIFNPYFDWPLSSQDFTKMIKGNTVLQNEPKNKFMNIDKYYKKKLIRLN